MSYAVEIRWEVSSCCSGHSWFQMFSPGYMTRGSRTNTLLWLRWHWAHGNELLSGGTYLEDLQFNFKFKGGFCLSHRSSGGGGVNSEMKKHFWWMANRFCFLLFFSSELAHWLRLGSLERTASVSSRSGHCSGLWEMMEEQRRAESLERAPERLWYKSQKGNIECRQR